MRVPGFSAEAALHTSHQVWSGESRAGGAVRVVPAGCGDFCEAVCNRTGWNTYGCLHCWQHCDD